MPTVATQLEGDAAKIRRSILLGTSIPGAMFLIWNLCILGQDAGGPAAAGGGGGAYDPVAQLVSSSGGVVGPIVQVRPRSGLDSVPFRPPGARVARASRARMRGGRRAPIKSRRRDVFRWTAAEPASAAPFRTAAPPAAPAGPPALTRRARRGPGRCSACSRSRRASSASSWA